MSETISDIVRSFYEQYPFPGYDDIDTPSTLIARARRGIFAQLLDDQIPFGARVLDVGCGTGQLSNFLALGGRQVVGIDLSRNSLEKAREFQKRFNIPGVTFVQGDLFSAELPDANFDFVLCNGVLHHTADAEGGFARLCRWMKPQGYVVVGLYNTFGRLLFRLWRTAARSRNSAVAALDRTLQRRDLGENRKSMWFADQYRHPHETSHTVEEVLRWFRENQVVFLNGIPKIAFGDPFTSHEQLFQPHPIGSRLEHALRQLGWMVTQRREGGFFVLIGKKGS